MTHRRAACGGAILALLTGCATPERPAERAPVAPAAKVAPAPPPVEYVAPAMLESQHTAAIRAVTLIVRAAAPGEIDSRSFDELQRALGVGAAVGAIGLTEALVLPFSMFSPGVLLGSIVVTIGTAAGLGAERARQERVVRAVREVDFEARLRAAIGPRLETAGPDAGADATLEVVMLAYGVVEDRPRGTYCVFADLEIVLRGNAGEHYRDRVLILPARRSMDAPVPDCRLRGTLADTDRTVIRDALADYARAMPAILARRLPGLPWRN
jgi:hypothetical protein